MNQSCDTPNRFLNSEDDKDLDAGAGRKVNLLDCCAGSYTHVLPSSVKNPIGDLCAVTFPSTPFPRGLLCPRLNISVFCQYSKSRFVLLWERR